MNILIDGRLISKKPTGISRYSLELLNSYVERYGSNNITILLNEDIDVQCHKLFTKLKPYNLFHFLLFPFLIKFSNYNLFHCPFYVGPFLKTSRSIKIVLTIHDLMFTLVPGFFSSNKLLNNLGRIYYWILVRLSLNASELLVSVSNTTQQDLNRIFNKTSLVIPEGLNIQPQKDNSHNTELNFKLGSDYFLYVGNNRPHKNVDFLIDVFMEYSGCFKLVIVGHENLSNVDNHKIIYLTDVSDEELCSLYQNCKAYILPSKYEGFGLPILEAISNKAIIFSSNLGALKEFPFHSVKYFDPNNRNELLHLMQNVENYKFFDEDLRLLKLYDWKTNFNLFHDYIENHFLKP